LVTFFYTSKRQKRSVARLKGDPKGERSESSDWPLWQKHPL